MNILSAFRILLPFLFSMAWILVSNVWASAQDILEVGPGKPYFTLQEAAQDAQPGDTILLDDVTHQGGMYIAGLQGTPGAWITIRGNAQQGVTIQGGSNAVQFSDPAYLVIEHLRIREQTGNGLNIDDGGSYDTPAHHVVIRNCIFEDMAANGNNDLLKLSGLDSFSVHDCIFRNGAAGGSGIDMVGCHWGTFDGLHMENMGSNSIQAKGGSRYITIHRSWFKNGGQRSLNLGGSTGAAFFRPPGANYEAADIDVYANVFMGSQAPIAYVGSQRVRVWNNTIYRPDKWVIRILQESTDTSFYQAAGFGVFANNIVLVDNDLSITTNVGPNTNAPSFLFANNLWFHLDQPNWPGPFLPSTEQNGQVQVDPLLADASNMDFHLTSTSPAIQAGAPLPDSEWTDFDGFPYAANPSVGAFEWIKTTSLPPPVAEVAPTPFGPNPAHGILFRTGEERSPAWLYEWTGRPVKELAASESAWDVSALPQGLYVIISESREGRQTVMKLCIQ